MANRKRAPYITPVTTLRGPWALRWCLKAALTVGTVLALVGLVLEYGFVHSEPAAVLALATRPAALALTRSAQLVAVAMFALVYWVQLFLVRGKGGYAKDRLVELVLSAGAGAALVLLILPSHPLQERHADLVVTGLQVYLVFQLLSAFVQLHTLVVRALLHPFRAIVSSFAVLIIVGALLLSLPASSYGQRFTGWGNNFVDHLFTSTSAVCVTGLNVRDTPTCYTAFGQLVIMTLIQLGGLGIVIFGTIFALLIGGQVSLREATVMRDLYSEEGLGQVRRVVKFVVLATLIIEAAGAALMFNMWQDPHLTTAQRTFKTIFHAVTAYCNAGFALQSDNMISYGRSWQTYLVIMPLIILGGLGFPVLANVAQNLGRRVRLAKFLSEPATDLDQYRILGCSLQTKVVVATSLALIVVGALALFVLETPVPDRRWGRTVQYEDLAVQVKEGTMRHHGWPQRLLDAAFQSVSARTCGLNTIEMSSGSLRPGSLVVIITLMSIGGSPASTAGGMKTVTFTLLVAAVVAALRRRANVEMFKRTVDRTLIRRALVLAFLYIGLVWVMSLVLVVIHPQMNYLDLLFETASACGTVGYSTGVTAHLSLAGRLAIVFCMFAGRVGPLTLLFALTRTGKTIRYEYPREGLVIG